MDIWLRMCQEKKQMRRSADAVIRRWNNVLVAPAFNALKQHTINLKGKRTAGAKVVCRWQRFGLSRGFFGLRNHAARQRHTATTLNKMVRGWILVLVGKAMSRWMEYVPKGEQVLRSAIQMALRIRSPAKASVFGRWKKRVRVVGVLGVIMKKVVGQSACKAQALALWEWWEEVRRRRLAKRSALRWMQKSIRVAWSTWGTWIEQHSRLHLSASSIVHQWDRELSLKKQVRPVWFYRFFHISSSCNNRKVIASFFSTV
jgi:hypothetical protein